MIALGNPRYLSVWLEQGCSGCDELPQQPVIGIVNKCSSLN